MEQLKHYPANSFRVCLDSIEPTIKGTAYSPLSSEAIKFRDLGRLMVTLDELFDEKGYPQSYQDKRSFLKGNISSNHFKGKPEVLMSAETIESMRGEVATFDVLVETRRNSSWQGICFDEQKNKMGTFDGDMELMSLIFSKYENLM